MDTSHTQILPYNSDWEAIYSSEAEKLRRLFGDDSLGIKHIGSTAIRGLSSKPIIDIAVLVSSPEKGEQYIKPLAEIGYVYDAPASSGERLFFRKGSPTTYHLSVAYSSRGTFWNRQIYFKDYLQKHAEARDEYALLKKELLKKDPSGKASYIAGKSAFIQAILDKNISQ